VHALHVCELGSLLVRGMLLRCVLHVLVLVGCCPAQAVLVVVSG
jgi:hypothetical protein